MCHFSDALRKEYRSKGIIVQVCVLELSQYSKLAGDAGMILHGRMDHSGIKKKVSCTKDGTQVYP